MLRLFKISITLIFIFGLKTSKAQHPFWTDGTAFTVPRRTFELCLFRPARYGLTKKAELSAHPVAFFVFPHLFLKRRLIDFEIKRRKKFYVSTKHGLYYPTFLLNKADNLDTYLLNNFYESSSIIVLQNEIIVSHFLDKQTHCNVADKMITGNIGLKYAYNSSDSISPVVLQSILFRETMVFTPEYIWYIGLRFDAHLSMIFNYFVDFNFYSVGLGVDFYSVESKAGIMGYSGKNIKAFVGIKTGYSTMIDKNRFLLMPIAGISYSFKRKAKREKELGLFGRKIFKYKDTSTDDEIKYMDKDWKKKRDSVPVVIPDF